MNWKKFWFGLISIGVPLTMLAATIRWYNDAAIPEKTTLADTDIISIQQTGPNAYRWAYASSLKRYAGVSNVTVINTNYIVYGSNYYSQDTYVSNYFFTNVFNDTFVSNYFFDFIYYTNVSVTNVTITNYVSSDTYVSNTVITNVFNDTYVSNYYVTNVFPTLTNYVTNTIGGDFIANLGGFGTNTVFFGGTVFPELGTNRIVKLGSAGELISIPNGSGVLSNDGFGTLNWIPMDNVIESNVYQTFNVNKLTVNTNIYFLQATPQDIAWGGPTNQVDLSAGSLQNYTTLVPISITNVVNPTNGYGSPVLLCITNSSASNISATLPSGWLIGRGDVTSVTNGGILEIWFLEASGRKTIATKEFIAQ